MRNLHATLCLKVSRRELVERATHAAAETSTCWAGCERVFEKCTGLGSRPNETGVTEAVSLPGAQGEVSNDALANYADGPGHAGAARVGAPDANSWECAMTAHQTGCGGFQRSRGKSRRGGGTRLVVRRKKAAHTPFETIHSQCIFATSDTTCHVHHAPRKDEDEEEPQRRKRTSQPHRDTSGGVGLRRPRTIVREGPSGSGSA